MKNYHVSVFLSFEEVQNDQFNVKSHAYENQRNHKNIMQKQYAHG